MSFYSRSGSQCSPQRRGLVQERCAREGTRQLLAAIQLCRTTGYRLGEADALAQLGEAQACTDAAMAAEAHDRSHALYAEMQIPEAATLRAPIRASGVVAV